MNETKQDDTRTLLQKKADAFWLLGTRIHISYLSGIWKRGIIKKNPIENADFFLLEESLEGEIPIFWDEVKSIEVYTPKKEDWK